MAAAGQRNIADVEDVTYTRVERLLAFVEGRPASDFAGRQGFEEFSHRVQPHSPGLRGRMWYGAGSLPSARWAGAHDMNLLCSSVVFAEPGGPIDFAQIQLEQIRASGPSTRPDPRAGCPRVWW